MILSENYSQNFAFFVSIVPNFHKPPSDLAGMGAKIVTLAIITTIADV